MDGTEQRAIKSTRKNATTRKYALTRVFTTISEIDEERQKQNKKAMRLHVKNTR
jgi:hypothetical protein